MNASLGKYQPVTFVQPKNVDQQMAKVIAEFRADVQKDGFENFVKDFCNNILENPPR